MEKIECIMEFSAFHRVNAREANQIYTKLVDGE